ncbi:hypothetical protein CSOJ01_11949 [Colletotrichum sojae]|uniref:Uncharacterized protein n=1 Tax=Colletotrichum sojae TaxID=2175907 RepID=A0A8H6IW24_9PEZI|nr:hypothetical protein CSOJ01_11949 [Colletotrichum sojae]
MQFSTVFAVLASIATVHAAAAAEPHVREVASLMARQRDCASIGAKVLLAPSAASAPVEISPAAAAALALKRGDATSSERLQTRAT